MTDVPADILAELRRICGALPEAYEEPAWVGRRWRIRKKTFAHVLLVDAGWPPAYARAAGIDGPACVLTFSSGGAELEALRNAGAPFFKPRWRLDIVGMVLATPVDWDEIAELLADSYCRLAPQKLAERVRALDAWPAQSGGWRAMDDVSPLDSTKRLQLRVRVTTSSYWLAAGTAALLLAMAAAGAAGLLRDEPVRQCADPRGGSDGDPALISLDTAKACRAATPCW